MPPGTIIMNYYRVAKLILYNNWSAWSSQGVARHARKYLYFLAPASLQDDGSMLNSLKLYYLFIYLIASRIPPGRVGFVDSSIRRFVASSIRRFVDSSHRRFVEMRGRRIGNRAKLRAFWDPGGSETDTKAKRRKSMIFQVKTGEILYFFEFWRFALFWWLHRSDTDTKTKRPKSIIFQVKTGGFLLFLGFLRFVLFWR